MKIRTITIDFWGTLLFDGPGSDDRYKRRRMADFEAILEAEGVPATAAALDRAYEASGSFLAGVWATYRDVPVDQHVKAIVDAVDPGLYDDLPASARAALLDAYARPALLVPPTVDDGAPAALETLCSRGYTLAVVSNTMRTPGTTLRKLLERYRILGCFEHVTFSDEIGVRKPDARIFHLTLQAVGGDVGSSVHVGDDPILDVGGARAAGMRAIQVTDAPLRALGVLAPVAVIKSMAALPDAIADLDR
ncbi:MAG: HAD family hydrolase [Candidatus Rokubacteria bacterium]|nr:HAD family hydrolase [Candidatus Rokubacteria bacterium]